MRILIPYIWQFCANNDYCNFLRFNTNTAEDTLKYSKIDCLFKVSHH